MKDCTYELLLQFQNADLTESEIAAHLEFPVTIQSLERRHLIAPLLNVYGEPTSVYRITDEGREFIRQRLEENRRAKRDFILSFISGIIVGVIGTLIVQWITAIL